LVFGEGSEMLMSLLLSFEDWQRQPTQSVSPNLIYPGTFSKSILPA